MLGLRGYSAAVVDLPNGVAKETRLPSARRAHFPTILASSFLSSLPTSMFRLLGLLPSSLLVLLALSESTQAFTFSGWPFAKKRFVDDGLIAAGHLGFSADFKGRIAAVGDWDGDQLWVASEHFQKAILSGA